MFFKLFFKTIFLIVYKACGFGNKKHLNTRIIFDNKFSLEKEANK